MGGLTDGRGGGRNLPVPDWPCCRLPDFSATRERRCVGHGKGTSAKAVEARRHWE
ncbi:hypothetical protein DVDV_1111 [Desulfovibrio sp. DV]|nr:hypothetical protein DVDV_1111 [Desulfovibrio sp. DV]